MQALSHQSICFLKVNAPNVPHMIDSSNNISAGRVVTKMQFDTKSPVPKLLFSPVGAVPADDVEKVLTQSKGAAAESAVKLTVFQTDEGDNGGFPPAPAEAAPETDEAPKLREPAKPASDKSADMSDIVKKWADKKAK